MEKQYIISSPTNILTYFHSPEIISINHIKQGVRHWSEQKENNTFKSTLVFPFVITL